MRILIARHGETDFNAQGRYMGSTDLPLNETGIRQAHELAGALSGCRFDRMASSTMLRAMMTADIVSAKLGISYALYPEFRERCVGAYEGLTRDEARERHPDMWNRQCTSKPDDAPDGGETLREFCARVDAGLERLKREMEGSVLVICHGAVSRAINRYCLGLNFDDMIGFRLGNCETREYDLG